jgi:UDP-3-O-[3-hydroxymyristoyl] N-acetylglucosamine deacetylase/3-hydroxyacyl-[acyl-carrier-protein] dehydratase
MSEKQRTIKSPVSVSGVGLHTGRESTLTFNPAPPNHGIKFRRTDINPEVVVDADVDLVVDTSRGTSIEFQGSRFDTIEHVMAALRGLEIDNVLIDMTQSETPILDGSSRYYVENLGNVGTIEQNAPRKYFELNEIITYTNPEKKVEMIAMPAKDFRVSVMIDYESRVLHSQNAHLSDIRKFKDEIARCRTFVFLHELEYLLNNNLIKGGDLSNAIVFVNRAVSKEELDHLAKIFNKPKVEVIPGEGILNNLDLQYPNEPARHKLLDVIGDVSLVGMPIKAHIIATRPGHYSNVQFAKLIKKQIKKEKRHHEVHKFDLTRTVYDINQIQKMLPHRPPFLLIDRIIEMGSDYVVGLKNVTMNEGFFVGHFPQEPVMPGVLQIEAMAQTGGILALSTVEDPHNYVTYFVKIENVKFRNKVVPGDTIIFYNQLSAPIRRGLVSMKGLAYVGSKLVMEAEMMAQVTRK